MNKPKTKRMLKTIEISEKTSVSAHVTLTVLRPVMLQHCSNVQITMYFLSGTTHRIIDRSPSPCVPS